MCYNKEKTPEISLMNKLILLLLVCCFCVPALAENDVPAVANLDLFPLIGNSTRADFLAAVSEPFFKGVSVEDGSAVYLGESYASCVVMRHTRQEREINHGWEPDTVFYVSLSKTGYSLNAISVGDNIADIDALCIEDGWTKMDVPPDMLDGGYEKTVDGVRYTLGYIIEYGTECINFVSVQAAMISE